MMHIQTWILIADGARARVLESKEADHPLRAIEDLVFHGDHSSTPPAALIFQEYGESPSLPSEGRDWAYLVSVRQNHH